jgi:hypothetical protein
MPAPETDTVPVPALPVAIVICEKRSPPAPGLNCIDTVQLAPGARDPGTLHVVVVGNSFGFELVSAVMSMATSPLLVSVKTAPVNDVLPTMVAGNANVCGLIVICDNVADTPVPDVAIETLPPFVVVMVI